MNDQEVIKNVATRLGWTEIKMSTDHEGCLIIQGRLDGVRVESRPWDQSVDAALSVLDKNEFLLITWDSFGKAWRIDYQIKGNVIVNESLPRAILLAFLEVK